MRGWQARQGDLHLTPAAVRLGRLLAPHTPMHMDHASAREHRRSQQYPLQRERRPHTEDGQPMHHERLDILPRLKSGDSYCAHPGIEPE